MISIYGVELGCRYVFLVSIVLITVQLFVRQILLRETKIGEMLSSREEDGSLFSKNYMEILGIIWKNRLLLVLFLLSIMGRITERLSITFRPLFLTDLNGLALSESAISVLPTAASITNILALFLIVRRIRSVHIKRALLISYTAGFTGLILLILAPEGSMIMAISSFVLDSGRQLATLSILPVFFMNTIDEVNPFIKAKITSLLTTFTALISWPIPTMGGYLYSVDPSLPFIISALTMLISVAILSRI